MGKIKSVQIVDRVTKDPSIKLSFFDRESDGLMKVVIDNNYVHINKYDALKLYRHLQYEFDIVFFD